MAGVWSADQVLALAPDASSASSGRGLANTRKWVGLGATDEVLWGECQGSGSKPYQTKVELATPAFHCSCPSRKFPCKHALGLFLLWAGQAASFTQKECPDWVTSWLEGRARSAEQKAAKEQARQEKIERGEPLVDPVAKQKREEARRKKVEAGLQELHLWLFDLVKQGLATIQGKPFGFWDERARRLIDAQAPSVARRVQELGALSFSRDGWHEALLERLSRLHLLIEGFTRLDAQSPETQADIRSEIGFPIDQDDLRAGPGVRDVWQVIGQQVEVEERLRVQRTWLIGRQNARPALILDFAHGAQPIPTVLPPGSAFEAELVFFPGASPLRALVKSREGSAHPIESLTGHTRLIKAHAAYADALALNPWLTRIPLVIESVTLKPQGDSWLIRDSEGRSIPLSPRFSRGWHLLALSGGRPVTLSGEYDGHVLEPLAAWTDGQFVVLSPAESEAASPAFSLLGAPPDLVSSWQSASASALVGVDRKPPALPSSLDGPLGPALQALETSQPPHCLLGLAASLSLYGRAGRRPALDPSADLGPCSETDDQPVCSPQANARLRLMLSGTHAEVIPEWLERLSASGRRLAEDALKDLLDLALRQKGLRPLLPPVLGRRGLWISRLNPDWEFARAGSACVDPESTWQTGSAAERLSALKQLRVSNPTQARTLVESTWSTESAEDRSLFLATFAEGLGLDDEPFLESALDDRSKNVRRAASDLLARLPDSRFGLRMSERASSVLTVEGRSVLKALLGGNTPKLRVEPPSACSKDMVRDGIEAKPPSGVGERAWWLRQLVGLSPLSVWLDTSQSDPEPLVRAALNTEWGYDLWNGWFEATYREQEEDWTLALLRNPPKKPKAEVGHLSQLLEVLSPAHRDEFLLELLHKHPEPFTSTHPSFALLEHVRSPVGEPLAREVLRRLVLTFEATSRRPGKQRFDYTLWTFLSGLALIVPPSLSAEADSMLSKAVGNVEHLGPEVLRQLEILRFRHEMNQEFSR